MSQRRILCVDPDGFGLQVRRLVLESRGYHVFAFTQTEEAVEFLRHHRADAVMMDESLEGQRPGTARQLKAMQPAVPIIMLSNHPYPPEGVSAYVDYFLTRGEAPQQLLAVVHQAIENAPTGAVRLRPWLWAGGAVATGAAWLAARAFRARHAGPEASVAPKKPSANAGVSGRRTQTLRASGRR